MVYVIVNTIIETKATIFSVGIMKKVGQTLITITAKHSIKELEA